jgi:hypothetical protein
LFLLTFVNYSGGHNSSQTLRGTMCAALKALLNSARKSINSGTRELDLSKGVTVAAGQYAELDGAIRIAGSRQWSFSFPEGGELLDTRFGYIQSRSNPLENIITDGGVGAGAIYTFSTVGAPELWNGKSWEEGANIQPLAAAGVLPFPLNLLAFISIGGSIGNQPSPENRTPAAHQADTISVSIGINVGASPGDAYMGKGETDAVSVSFRDMGNAHLDDVQRIYDKMCK